jgi:hypothetical protein
VRVRVVGSRVAGLLVVVGALAGCDTGADPSSVPVTSTTLPTASAQQTRTPASSPFAALRRGAPPAIGYVLGRVHIAPDGVRTRLPIRHGISEIARYDGSLLVADALYFEGTNGLRIVEGERVEEIEPCTSGGGAVSRDGSQAAWATFACPESGLPAPTVLHRRSAAGTISQEIPVDSMNPLTAVAGLLGEDVIYDVGSRGGVFVTDLRSEPRPVDGLRWVASVDEVGHRVAGAAGPDGRRGVVVDLSGRHHQWRTGRTRLGPFNPSGTAIVGCSGRTWAVRDAATGRQRYVLGVPERVYLSHLVWEDDRHLLAVMSWRREHAIIRFDGRGRPELATPVVTSRGLHTGYVLETRP